MKKEELEAIFGTGCEAPDLGPIETYLDALATERHLPDFAIAVCTARIDEAAPALRALLTRAADGEELSEDEAMLLFRGLYILGWARDSQTFQPLLRLLRRPRDDIDYLLGASVTQSMARIVAGVFDGDVEALFCVITERTLNEFVRNALLGAATFLTWDGRIEGERMRQFLTDFYQRRLAEAEDYVWIGWLEAIGYLGLRDLAPLVRSAWTEGLVPDGMLELADFEKDLADAEKAPDDIKRLEAANLGYINDVIDALNWTRRETIFDDEDRKSFVTDVANPFVPFVNPMRSVGRNDPCPCGSGKKAKKCCLAS